MNFTFNRKLVFKLLFALLSLSGIPAFGQLCEGSLGDPVVNINFGTGGGRGPRPSIITTYRFIASGSPNGEGDYAIAQSTTGLNRGWYDIFNHTPGDFGGYMMIVNAAPEPGIFYESAELIELCPNTTYEFGAWLVNLLRNIGIRPNVTFTVLDANGSVLGTRNTNEIPNGNPTWKQYAVRFRTTSGGQVKIRMTNNAPGGAGNDLAIDDITFRACGPEITSNINNTSTLEQNICERDNAIYNLSATVSGTRTLRYQWQLNTGTGWNDVAGETSTTMRATFTNAVAGTYRYRLAVAEPSNFDSPLCRTSSPEMIIYVNKYPEPKAISNSPVCVGNDIILDVEEDLGTYQWLDPAGNIISTSKSHVIKNATFAMSGKYTVVVTSRGCSSSANVEVGLVPPPVPAVENAIVEVCEGSSVGMRATGGTSYTWSPSTGLSATNIPNPLASPAETTTYTVTVSNGSCDRSLQVKVIINKKPVSNAGEDKRIILGKSVMLNGIVAGDKVTYLWSPAEGLDDPRKLNPIATPTVSTTYTLTVVSGLGCVTATDQAFVLVYEKIVVPPSFSPNGDGINDLWNITAIETYAKPRVRIVNRYGAPMYESTDYYNKPWNGKHNGKDVPVGTYYYLIFLEAEETPLSGSVTVIR